MKVLWNGIKSEGKLYRCFFSDGQLINHPAGTLTIYAKDYGNMSKEISAAFKVENNSDSMTDYFETSHIRVNPDHPLYAEVRKALDAQKAHRDSVYRKREQRYEQRRAAIAA